MRQLVPCRFCGHVPAMLAENTEACPACGLPLVAAAEKRVAPLAYAAMFSAVPILFIPYLFPIPLVLGLLALRQIRQRPQYSGAGRAVFALIWSGLGALLCAVISLVLINSR